MAESIKLPTRISGSPEAQLHQLYSYLYQMAQTLNVNLKEIGSSVLTKDEQDLMNSITQSLQEPGEQPDPAYNYAEAETLKSLIIKTAQFVKNEVDNYRLVLFGEESAEGSQGNWKRKKGLRVDVTPDGTQQTYSYAEIIQGLKTFEINAKNYIKTGLLRMVNGVPVYGVAIGKDIVTFSEDGTETYNDGNKVAELIADALTFYQGEHPVAKFTGSKLSFYINGSEIFYIQGGKIYCAQDLELASGKKLIINTTNFKVDSSGNVTISGKITAGSGSTFSGTVTLGGNNNTNGQLIIQNANGTQIGKWDKDGIEAITGVFRGSLATADGTFAINPSTKTIKLNDWLYDENGLMYDLYNQFSVFTVGQRREDWSDGHRLYETNIKPTGGGTFDLSFCDKWGKFAYMNISGAPGNASPGHPDTDTSEQIKIMSVRSNIRFGEDNYPIDSILVNRIGKHLPTGSATYVKEAYITTINYVYLVQTSSREVKHNIQPLPDRGAEIDALVPVTFVYNNDAEERQRAGLIYEDTIGIMPEICTGKENNKAINYVELIPYLLKETQELRKRMKVLEEKVQALESKEDR